MTANSRRTDGQDRLDPMIEVLLKELMGTKSHAKAAMQTEDTVTAALTEEILASLIPSSSTSSASQPSSSMETILLATILAPALADALAPLLADVLAPALVKALNDVLAAKGTGQTGSSKKGSDK